MSKEKKGTERRSHKQSWQESCATPEEIKARYPNALTLRATRSQCPFAPLALAYKESGKVRAAVLQPDEALREHLLQKIKEYMK